MGKPVVSHEAFRGLFAFYAAKAYHDHESAGEQCLLRLFGSVKDIPDRLLQQWSDRVELLDPETVGRIMEPQAHQVTSGNARYDHACDFLHAVLNDLGQKVQ
ncbi:hypothetical protein [Bradyrhizobium centrosematis]|uniref:hypothetical protein n=1 Tax=Bradyrhizobium centrosematis TaxID=1300039 RepID=UPI002168DE9A|nr:hypothetical protein [Bradyrhizobium centrosematis]MCS3765076.1 hypothetical protein [Bradyrhizobium centrosematis]MCS3777648.1 hypothetical protein [Bradyrhizobium centrosematis]